LLKAPDGRGSSASYSPTFTQQVTLLSRKMMQIWLEPLHDLKRAKGWMHDRWIEVDDYVLAATIDREDGKKFRLSVEWLPTGGWDWVVWSSTAESYYGVTASCDAAMIAAETAVARG
jgi:hypothetical protein